MTYPETLSYLYSRLPVFQREGAAAYKPGLDNTLRLDAALGNPHKQYKTIHIAGTNGKGSVSHLLASVLQHAGYKVGLYTSPHLKDFRERIKVNGTPAGEEFVCSFTEKNKALFEEVNPSFFEATMCMAFCYFAQEKVDIAVIETGLGGRLDSTNIISPILSVITNISFDHTQFLGKTLEDIATEKAGIIKPQTPVVIGETTPETKTVFLQKASAENAPIHFAEEEIKVKLSSILPGKQVFDCDDFPQLTVGLGGIYQQKNTATALCAIRELKKQISLPDETIRKGFGTVCETTNLQGRWQQLQSNPTVICDTGHNEAGIRYIVQQLQMLPHKTLRIVLGMVNDKDIHTMLSLLPTQAVYYFCNADIPRALPAEELQSKASQCQLQGKAYGSVANALGNAKKDADNDDLIFVGGSTFVVAEVV
jgi:dihydrofolate synthase/folylpolyglutamate synthase